MPSSKQLLIGVLLVTAYQRLWKPWYMKGISLIVVTNVLAIFLQSFLWTDHWVFVQIMLFAIGSGFNYLTKNLLE